MQRVTYGLAMLHPNELDEEELMNSNGAGPGRFIGAVFGLGFLGIGLTVLGFLWLTPVQRIRFTTTDLSDLWFVHRGHVRGDGRRDCLCRDYREGEPNGFASTRFRKSLTRQNLKHLKRTQRATTMRATLVALR